MSGTSTGDYDDGVREVEASSRTESRRNPSLVSLALARNASKPAGLTSMDTMELIQGLYKGVILDDDKVKVKFWIDEDLHENCFMVLARGMRIIWVENEEYWRWSTHREDCFGGPFDIDVAELDHVWWLDINGRFPSIMLSPMVTYEVAFMLKMATEASGWHSPVNLGLSLPNKATQNRTEVMDKKPRGQWFEIPVGDFKVTTESIGYIEFFLNEHSNEHSKTGLIVKGVIFRPKSRF